MTMSAPPRITMHGPSGFVIEIPEMVRPLAPVIVIGAAAGRAAKPAGGSAIGKDGADATSASAGASAVAVESPVASVVTTSLAASTSAAASGGAAPPGGSVVHPQGPHARQTSEKASGILDMVSLS